MRPGDWARTRRPISGMDVGTFVRVDALRGGVAICTMFGTDGRPQLGGIAISPANLEATSVDPASISAARGG